MSFICDWPGLQLCVGVSGLGGSLCLVFALDLCKRCFTVLSLHSLIWTSLGSVCVTRFVCHQGILFSSGITTTICTIPGFSSFNLCSISHSCFCVFLRVTNTRGSGAHSHSKYVNPSYRTCVEITAKQMHNTLPFWRHWTTILRPQWCSVACSSLGCKVE